MPPEHGLPQVVFFTLIKSGQLIEAPPGARKPGNENMEILINSGGNLFIKRGGKYKDQYCPFVPYPEDKPIHCGDWCPHFGEPEQIFDNDTSHNVDLCHGKFLHGSITDERK